MCGLPFTGSGERFCSLCKLLSLQKGIHTIKHAIWCQIWVYFLTYHKYIFNCFPYTLLVYRGWVWFTSDPRMSLRSPMKSPPPGFWSPISFHTCYILKLMRVVRTKFIWVLAAKRGNIIWMKLVGAFLFGVSSKADFVGWKMVGRCLSAPFIGITSSMK